MRFVKLLINQLVWSKQLPKLDELTNLSTRSIIFMMESFCRQTLVQLNLGEGRHSLGRSFFHGKRGELHQRYRAGQEDQLGALGMVLNIITLWNTIYMDAAINQLRQEGFPVYDEVVARLSAYGYGHINCSDDIPLPCQMR